MTDMRNFQASNDIRAESAFVDSDDIVIKDNYALDETDGSGLGQFHRNSEELEETSGRSKTIGALVVALMLGAAGAYTYSMMPANEAVAEDRLPQPTAPATNTAAMTPPAPVTAPETTAPVEAAPAATPAAPERQAAAPRVVTPRAATPMTDPTPLATAPAPVSPPVVAPQSQASAIPEPVSPTPPASAVAGNPPLNEQSAAPVETPVTPAAPVEAAPAEPAAPAEASPVQ